MDSQQHNSEDNNTGNEEGLHDHIIAAMCDGCRLHFIIDLLLDADLQPTAGDFSITYGEEKRSVKAASLKSAVRRGTSWSLVSLLLDSAIEPGTEIQVNYHPRQWFLWSLETDAPIESLDFSIVVTDTRSIRGINLEVEQSSLEAIPTQIQHVDVEPTIEFAHDQRIQITFNSKLDVTQQPHVDDFRAESQTRWLTIGNVHLAKAGQSKTGNDPWPELWIMLREPLPAGSTVEVGYKPAETGLHTAEGEIVKPFRISGNVDEQEQSFEFELAPDAIDAMSEETVEASQPETIAQACRNILALSSNDINNLDYNLTTEAETSGNDALAISEEEIEIEHIYYPADYEHIPIIGDEPSKVVRTYLSDGSSVTLNKDELIEETPKDTPEEAPKRKTKANIQESLKSASLPVKIAVGAGLIIVGWFIAAILAFMLKLFGVSLTLNGLTTTQVNYTGVRESCKLEYSDGSRFEGSCLNGMRDGGGAYYWATGEVYKGDWVSNIRKGNGMLQYANGDIYTGTFDHNQKHGMGSMHWANGARYQGGYKNGKFHGRGNLQSSTGTRFEGVFENGKMSEDGTCYFVDGTPKPGSCPLN